MTLHEIVTSLFWIVAGGYLLYLGWFVADSVRRRPSSRRPRSRRDETPRPWRT